MIELKQAEAKQVCQICGTSVPNGPEPVTVDGTYGGWTFAWERGLPKLVAIRCPAHPLHGEQRAEREALERAAMDAERVRDWIDDTEIRDESGEEVLNYGVALLAAVQTLDSTLPDGVRFTFDGHDTPRKFPSDAVTNEMFEEACRGELKL